MKDSYTNVDDFFSDYRKEHAVCPKCGSEKRLSSIVGFIPNLSKAKEYKDRNTVRCECGWKGIAHDLLPEGKSGTPESESQKLDAPLEKLSDILEIVEFPTCEDLTNMKPDFGYVYLNHVFAEGFLNTLDKKTCYMIARYSLDEHLDSYSSHLPDSDPSLKPYFDNIKALEEVPAKDWIHTDYGKHCVDDVIVTGYDERDFRHYYMVWRDCDVSDCCIYKVRKEHYPTFEDFNKAVTEYIHEDGYKINPIRQPNGWVRW